MKKFDVTIDITSKRKLQIFKEDTTMTNKEKALVLIGTFVSGDLEKTKSLV